jgi:hypothetical protein
MSLPRHPASLLRFALVCLPLVNASCGGDDAPADPDASTAIDAPGTTPRARVGFVDISEDRWRYPDDAGGGESLTARIDARFFDGTEPQFHHETMRAGDCVLRNYTFASCDPVCTTGFCVETNVCAPFPTYVSAGRLSIAGLATAVQIDPRQNYYYLDEPLPADLFTNTADITLTLAGATIPGLTVASRGVAPIAPDITGGVVTAAYPATGPLVIHWPPLAAPETGSRVRLTLNANNRGHGAPFEAIITCDVADEAGQVAVPAAMLDAFPDTSAWTICAGTDCPPSKLERYRSATAPVGDHDVELRVVNSFTFGIEHPRPE